MADKIPQILVAWDVPNNIKTLVTTRQGGCSQTPFDSFNLAEHVGDDNADVQENRQKLNENLPSAPIWLNQVHSNVVVEAQSTDTLINADGSYTSQSKVVSVVMTADCLPVLITNRQGSAVAAVHAGWRGLASGIIEQGVKEIIATSQCQANDIRVWLGPAIGAAAFEVGDEVKQIFLQQVAPTEQSDVSACFIASQNQHKWLADIYQLARLRLASIGVENCSGGTYCTYEDDELFYSYRRDGQTGRMASMIWMNS
ncbi:peptidoglycan editing factor PgeF [sulfur-oxidizing endosymbiont of Gigantopelta aegis]|uniref:peptidoglycan editing factor PgeF n=1 Tax=sulfur-oxidizing endosymbiont of Gigantopelta aegis TaxID=2794934 RepID=UPI0018DB4CBD|nr:peptidoglycan editing factor PgeF [sulfur-oxidizing endosymbiont of Gigantopelta aegis]